MQCPPGRERHDRASGGRLWAQVGAGVSSRAARTQSARRLSRHAAKSRTGGKAPGRARGEGGSPTRQTPGWGHSELRLAGSLDIAHRAVEVAAHCAIVPRSPNRTNTKPIPDPEPLPTSGVIVRASALESHIKAKGRSQGRAPRSPRPRRPAVECYDMRTRSAHVDGESERREWLDRLPRPLVAEAELLQSHVKRQVAEEEEPARSEEA